ncbi:FGGY family carbohydrate kinase [Robbsia sp. KACC 23696]|uniref:FGGY family carbohydrate kinase n=1 Tax=Robbsia sp. KACC 23696 TaxID=3149231 RepID=UPI00325AA818
MASNPRQQRIFCGIDVGSTNVKVILIDETARTLWTKAIAMPRVDDTDGGKDAIATDVSPLVATLEDLIIEGWHKTGAGAPIAAIAVTGVGEDGVPVDAALRPLDTAIPWFDRRADALATLDETLGELADIKVTAGVKLDFSRTAAKWRWLRRHRQAAMGRAAFWLTLTDYPAAWWAQTPFISETLAARTACYDVFARRWSAPMLAACGAPPLPAVSSAGDVIGVVCVGRLLSSGAADGDTLVIAGGHDHPVAASAIKRLRPDAIVDSLGTANLMYDEIASISPRTDPFIAFSVPVSGKPGLACLGVFEFAASLAPFRRQSGDATGAENVLQRYLSQDHAGGTPGNVQAITASLHDALQADHTMSTRAVDERHLRLALEAGCLYARCMRDAIAMAHAAGGESAGLAADAPVYVVGGWARSTALLQLRASVFGRQVYAVEEDELTALGVALIARDAAVTAQALVGTASLSAQPSTPHHGFVRKTHRFDPVPAWRDAYDRIYPTFREYASAELTTLADHDSA